MEHANLAVHGIEYNSLTQNQYKLKFWIYDSYVDTYLLMTLTDDAKIGE